MATNNSFWEEVVNRISKMEVIPQYSEGLTIAAIGQVPLYSFQLSLDPEIPVVQYKLLSD